ncbi:ankyrin repeat domain-containing protein, partial [Escherichia sp. TWPC-MK]
SEYIVVHSDTISNKPFHSLYAGVDTYNSLELIKFLKQNGVNFMLAEHSTVELYVKDMRSIFNEIKQHIEIKHTQFYNCRNEHIGIYTGIERVKWFIRNGIRMDDDILR